MFLVSKLQVRAFVSNLLNGRLVKFDELNKRVDKLEQRLQELENVPFVNTPPKIDFKS